MLQLLQTLCSYHRTAKTSSRKDNISDYISRRRKRRHVTESTTTRKRIGKVKMNNTKNHGTFLKLETYTGLIFRASAESIAGIFVQRKALPSQQKERAQDKCQGSEAKGPSSPTPSMGARTTSALYSTGWLPSPPHHQCAGSPTRLESHLWGEPQR